ncbi:Iron-responsive regulator Irr [hydrothermal vent metagenome]|uniref:Iron-responsive regulator Irr n=1 Tax=hydrothermal vent metagenome TaxID=652676 RepID=A0A3B0Y3K3_9ZZZZ
MADLAITAVLDEAQAVQRLQAHNILPTQQRLQIARVLLVCDQHLSADQVLERANASGFKVSKATVYNTLGLFAQRGMLREVNVDPSRIFYDTNTSKHHHFYNMDTGELSDIDPDKMPVDQLPDAPHGTVVDSIEVIIRVRSLDSLRNCS